MTKPLPKAVVLLSGGVDSATALAMARRDGFDLYALTFRYGQRHAIEIDASRRVAAAFQVARHEIVQFDLRRFGGSALTDSMSVPKSSSVAGSGGFCQPPLDSTAGASQAESFAPTGVGSSRPLAGGHRSAELDLHVNRLRGVCQQAARPDAGHHAHAVRHDLLRRRREDGPGRPSPAGLPALLRVPAVDGTATS